MTTLHKSIATIQNDLADANEAYAEKINQVVDSGDVTSLRATANILNAVSNLALAQGQAISALLAAVTALARDAGRLDVLADDDGFAMP